MTTKQDRKEIVAKELQDLIQMVRYLEHHPNSVLNASVTHPVVDGLTAINNRLEALVTIVRSMSEWEFRDIETRRPTLDRL